MAPLFSSQWSSSQDSSQSQGMLGAAPGADPRSPGFGGTQSTQAAAGMVRATLGATVAQSATLALSVPREDFASMGFTQGSNSTRSDTLSERAVVRRRFDRSAVHEIRGCSYTFSFAVHSNHISDHMISVVLLRIRQHSLMLMHINFCAADLMPLIKTRSHTAPMTCHA